MRDWNNFHGCEKLSDVECIDFLKHLEDSKRIDTEEGSFLHNQYIRELMNKRGLSVRTLDPFNGSIIFYNINNLKTLYNDIKSHPTSLLMCWGMRLEQCKRWIETIENEKYIEISIDGTLKTLDMIEDKILRSESIIDVIGIIISNMLSLLLTPNKNTLNLVFKDVMFSNDLGVCTLSLHELMLNWLKGNLIEYKQDNKIYIYSAKINRLSFTYEWKGYCNVPTEGKSKTYGKNSINIISNFIRKGKDEI
jgi:hypothetical protein